MLAWLLAATAAQAADADPPRLKYRARGPVCACESGMGENEIRRAWEARFGPESGRRAADRPAPDGGSTATGPGPARQVQQREGGTK
ncbi:MAG: hypothetical protein AMXMBFR52_15810 [Burkholderiales bacterium]